MKTDNELPLEVSERIQEDGAKATLTNNNIDPIFQMPYGLGYIAGATAEYLRSRWISVKDRLPELGDEYNVVWEPDASGSVVTTMEFEAIEKKFIDKAGFCDSDCTSEVTHWQPLPEPPTTGL